MSDQDQWCIATDGSFSVGEKGLCSLEYHQKLNLLLITSEESGIHVYDTTSSTLLKKTNASSAGTTTTRTIINHLLSLLNVFFLGLLHNHWVLIEEGGSSKLVQ